MSTPERVRACLAVLQDAMKEADISWEMQGNGDLVLAGVLVAVVDRAPVERPSTWTRVRVPPPDTPSPFSDDRVVHPSDLRSQDWDLERCLRWSQEQGPRVPFPESILEQLVLPRDRRDSDPDKQEP